VVKIRKFILVIVVTIVTFFTYSTVLADKSTMNVNGITTISGHANSNDTIEISLPFGKLIHVNPNRSGNYSTDVSDLSLGDTVYVTEVNAEGIKSQSIKRTITVDDIVQEDKPTSDIKKSSANNSSTRTRYHNEIRTFSWKTALLWVSGAVGVTVSGALFINFRYPKVKRSFFSLVGSGLLWRNQQVKHKVRLIRVMHDTIKKVFFDITTEELNMLYENGEVELNQEFTRFEIKAFNRQNDDIKMVLVDE